MSNQEDLQETLSKWRQETFRNDSIALQAVVASLKTPEPLVYAKPSVSQSKWMIFKSGSKKLATFNHVFIWHWGSQLETGNFVPNGELVPGNLASEKVLRYPGSSAVIKYVFDTKLDTSFQDNMKKMEDYLSTRSDFQKRKSSRKQWQNHVHEAARARYQAFGALFIQRPMNVDPPKVPYELHPWIEQVLSASSSFWPNPDRPRYFEAANGGIVNLDHAESTRFDRGDIVWVAFRIGISFNGAFWGTEMIPLELVRVGKVPEGTFDSVSWQTDQDFEPLTAGSVLRAETSPAPAVGQKRKALSPIPEPNTSEPVFNVQEHPNKHRALDVGAVPDAGKIADTEDSGPASEKKDSTAMEDDDAEANKENIDPNRDDQKAEKLETLIQTRSRAKAKPTQ